MMRGLVLKSSRNVFMVRALEREPPAYYECRLKGKVLKCAQAYYNPLAPGDIVHFEEDPRREGTGMIYGTGERRNFFTRYNRKGQLPQILAANIDALVCVTTPSAPPFRPRFIDRVLAQAEAAGIPAYIALNKTDLYDTGASPRCGDRAFRSNSAAAPPNSAAIPCAKASRNSRSSVQKLKTSSETGERLADFERMGYPALRLSAKTGEGLAAFQELFSGKLIALAGQSGVGKSSILNALCPAAALKTGAINEKYDRGNHTTVQSVLHEFEGAAGRLRIIDTPGVRQFVPCGLSAQNLMFSMPDFAPYAGKCMYGLSCSHETEAGCAVREAVARGVIHSDRYESFLRIKAELAELLI